MCVCVCLVVCLSVRGWWKDPGGGGDEKRGGIDAT